MSAAKQQSERITCMSPPGRDVAQLIPDDAFVEYRLCKFCKCEIKLYLVDYEECELCRICVVLGHEFLADKFLDILKTYSDIDQIAWKIGEYIWMQKDRRYQDSVDQQKNLMRELDRLERHRRLVSLLDEARQIQEDAGDPKPNARNRVYENIFEDMTKILREEYPDEQPKENQATPVN